MHDFESQRYITGEGKEIPLTYLENITLAVLFENLGNVVIKKQLCKKLYNQQEVDENREMSIRDLIKRLRAKLKGEVEIKTRRELGYYIFR